MEGCSYFLEGRSCSLHLSGPRLFSAGPRLFLVCCAVLEGCPRVSCELRSPGGLPSCSLCAPTPQKIKPVEKPVDHSTIVLACVRVLFNPRLVTPTEVLESILIRNTLWTDHWTDHTHTRTRTHNIWDAESVKSVDTITVWGCLFQDLWNNIICSICEYEGD